ncbi:solute carrier family 22 member 1-like isoform X1 [Clavelina lepadiformis]|uniref:solute carrier family 22 member 1-like isoform X1 n=1 Tax=Clavelina lepadiformis TaxID=159417 RepID=UPI0040419737
MQDLSKATEKFGFFQKRILLLLCLSGAFNAPFVIWFVIFPLYTPPHRCSIAAIDDASNSTCLNRSKSHVTLVSKSSCLFNITPIETGPDGTQRWSQCYTFNTTAECLAILLNLWFTPDSWRNDQEEFTTINSSDVGKCTDGWEYDTPDNLLTVPMEFDLVCDRSWLVPLASSLYMFGLLASSIIGGFVSDRCVSAINIVSLAKFISVLTILTFRR